MRFSASSIRAPSATTGLASILSLGIHPLGVTKSETKATSAIVYLQTVTGGFHIRDTGGAGNDARRRRSEAGALDAPKLSSRLQLIRREVDDDDESRKLLAGGH